MHETLDEALKEASRLADLRGAAYGVVSGVKNGRPLFRIYAMKGFGLPPGGTLEQVVEPRTERVHLEPSEKTSSNGF